MTHSYLVTEYGQVILLHHKALQQPCVVCLSYGQLSLESSIEVSKFTGVVHVNALAATGRGVRKGVGGGRGGGCTHHDNPCAVVVDHDLSISTLSGRSDMHAVFLPAQVALHEDKPKILPVFNTLP